jgi:hypothetical protein
MKISYLLVALLFVSSLAASTTARARLNNIAARSDPNVIEARQIAAPPWTVACMTDHGPSECGEPIWIYGSPARSRDTGMRSDAIVVLPMSVRGKNELLGNVAFWRKAVVRTQAEHLSS